VNVTVNGSARTLPDGACVGAAVRLVTQAGSGVAAAVNDSVISRAGWDSTPLAEGDRVEVLTAAPGG
jgi:sulfur carrier protein